MAHSPHKMRARGHSPHSGARVRRGQQASGGSVTLAGVRHALLRTFRWLLTTIVVVVAVMELANMLLPGHWMTLPKVGAAFGLAMLGMLSYELGKAVLRRRGR